MTHCSITTFQYQQQWTNIALMLKAIRSNRHPVINSAIRISSQNLKVRLYRKFFEFNNVISLKKIYITRSQSSMFI